MPVRSAASTDRPSIRAISRWSMLVPPRRLDHHEQGASEAASSGPLAQQCSVTMHVDRLNLPSLLLATLLPARSTRMITTPWRRLAARPRHGWALVRVMTVRLTARVCVRGCRHVFTFD